jgi:hypothetical protein
MYWEIIEMNLRHVSIDSQSQELQRFFQNLREEALIVELLGQPLCVLYPTARLSFQPDGPLQQAAGAWQLPLETAHAIAGDKE